MPHCLSMSIPPLSRVGALLALTPLAAAQQYGGGFEVEQMAYNPTATEIYGGAAAAIEDLNSDTIGDFLVAAPGADTGVLTNNGVVRLHSGVDGSLLHEFEGTADFERFGQAVIALPDIDGDFIADIAISSLKGDGEVTLWSGATFTLIDTIVAPAGAHDFGCDLAVIEDLDANGVSELLIGAENSEVLGIAAGAVYVYDLDTRLSLHTAEGAALGDTFGCAVAPIGDCNSDAIADYVVSAPGADAGGLINSGSVYLVSGADGSILLQVDGTRAGQFFGTSVLGLDDINGDLTPDFVVGTIRDYPDGIPAFFQGSVAVYSGADGTELRRMYGQEGDEQFGASLALGDDYDGDGMQDYLIGAPGLLYGGRVYVYYAGFDGMMTLMESEGPSDAYGTAVCALGDHDGDGSVGLLITAPGSDGSGTLAGGGYAVREYTDCVTASATSISNATGGTVTWDFDFPDDIKSSPTQFYQSLLSGLGTGPQELIGVTVPLSADTLYTDTFNKKYPGTLANPFGTMGPGNTATVSATFVPDGLPNLVGRTFYITAAWYEAGPGPVTLRGFARSQGITIDP